jgi:hypothetical protein
VSKRNEEVKGEKGSQDRLGETGFGGVVNVNVSATRSLHAASSVAP